MKRKVCSFTLMLLVLLLAMSVTAFAAGNLTAEVPVEIKVENPLPGLTETYTVKLTAVTAGAPMPGGASGTVYEASIEGAGALTLAMDYDKLGIYEYTLTQTAGSYPYCKYDSTEYELKVTVYVQEDGSLALATALRVKGETEKLPKASFTNKYDPLEPAKLDPPLEKKIENKRGTAPADSVFTFAMVPSPSDAPMPDPAENGTRVLSNGTQEKDHKGAGSFEFGWMTYDQEDVGKTYVYTLKEVARTGSDSKYFTYDSMLYYMTVVVGQEDGKVVLDVTYTDKDGKAVEKAVFTNVYDKPPAPAPSPDSGSSPKTGDDTNWWPWLLALVFSGGTLLADLVIRRRKNG